MDNLKFNILMEYLKGLFFKFVKTQAMKALIGAGLKLTGPVGAFASLLITKISEYAWKLIYKLGFKTKTAIEEEAKSKKDLKEYEDKINKPEATPKDIRDAGRDMLSK